MRTPALLLCLAFLSACRASAEPPSITTVGAQAARLKADLVSQLESWEPKAGAVELTFLRWAQGPRYRSGEQEAATSGRLVLKPGEQFSLVDHHFRMEFTLRAVSEGQLEFDYLYRHSPPGARTRETDTGRIVLSRQLERVFEQSWRACSTTAQCTIIPTYCGGYASVGKGTAELAQHFYERIREIKKCSPRTMPPPVATCLDGKCQPDPKFP